MSQNRGADPNDGDPLEALLRDAGEDVQYPATPAIARRVRARLGSQPRPAHRRWWAWRWPGGWEGMASPYLRWALPGLAVAGIVAVVIVARPNATNPSSQLASATPPAPAAVSPPRRQEEAASFAATPQVAQRADAPATPGAAPSGREAPTLGESAADQASAPASRSPAAPAAVAPTSAPPAVGRAAAPPAPAAGAAAQAGGRSAALPPDSLAAAGQRIGFTPLLPTLLGAPDAVEILENDSGPGLRLTYGERPGYSAPAGTPAARLEEYPASRAARESLSGELVRWAGGEGRWMPSAGGLGGVLEWEQAGLRLRLETPLTRDEAASIAASVAPAQD